MQMEILERSKLYEAEMKRGFAWSDPIGFSHFFSWHLAITLTHFQSHSGVRESTLDAPGLGLLTIMRTAE